MEAPIKTVIVDDEPLACKRLAKLLKEDKDVNVIEVCKNGKEAIETINEKKPELVFLDIQMPEVDGFDVLNNINRDHTPVIVFVTAYDEYAVRAFEVNAFDYLLKPFKKERLENALGRAKKAIRDTPEEVLNSKIGDLLETLKGSGNHLKRLMVKSSGQYFFIKAEDIDWVEAAGNYVRIHSGNKRYLIRNTMVNMEKKLDPDIFFRIHRSAIVNINRVKTMEKWFHGDYKVMMENGEELTMSRNYKELLEQF
ncbi:MAG: LytTR family DNA-binding domain-containing protein [Balneolaceae bacterium]|jgi:two-component system LytT family response regulator